MLRALRPTVRLVLFVTCLSIATARPAGAADDPSPETKALVSKLREDMKSSKPVSTRAAAYAAMGELGEKARWQRRTLCEGMLDPSLKVRTAAADALKKVDEPMYKLALGIFINRDLQDIDAAGKLGEQAEPLTPLVLAYAISLAPAASKEPGGLENLQARGALSHCVQALGAIAPDDEGVNKALIPMLGNPSPTLRSLALSQVPKLKNKKQALKGVLALAKNVAEPAGVRVRAVQVLPELVDEDTTPATRKALEALRFDTAEAVREAVSRSLDAIK